MVVGLGVLSVLSCAPSALDPSAGENTMCHFDGYEEQAVRGRLRTSFDYEGGDCRCDCNGIPVDLICTITATAS